MPPLDCMTKMRGGRASGFRLSASGTRDTGAEARESPALFAALKARSSTLVLFAASSACSSTLVNRVSRVWAGVLVVGETLLATSLRERACRFSRYLCITGCR